MNVSIQQYNNRIDEIKKNYEDGMTYMQIGEVTNNVQELSVMQIYLEDILEKIKKTKYELNLKYKKIKDVVFLQNNSGGSCGSGDIDYKYIYNDNLMIDHDLFSNIHLDGNFIEVNNVADIPNHSIYWIKSVKQYAINIGGMVLRGNIGNIYNSNMVKNIYPNNICNLVYCKSENLCGKILCGNICKFYHDPCQLLELKQLGLISEALYKQQLGAKNFINTSWIYTEYPEKHSNINMRHFGSHDTLTHFIQLAKIEDTSRIRAYIKNFKDQCMHDILVLYALYNNKIF